VKAMTIPILSEPLSEILLIEEMRLQNAAIKQLPPQIPRDDQIKFRRNETKRLPSLLMIFLPMEMMNCLKDMRDGMGNEFQLL